MLRASRNPSMPTGHKSSLSSTIASLALAGLLALPAAAAAADSRGIVTYTGGDHSGLTFWFECIGENAVIDSSWEARFHMFETAAGTVHVVDNWKYATLYTGLSSGRQWLAEGQAPNTVNVRMGKGMTNQWTTSSRLVPLDGGPAPTIMATYHFKMTFDALGNLKVEIIPSPDNAYTCLGPKR